MKYYLDEDVNPKAAKILRNRGYDAISALEVGMIETSDPDQLARAAAEDRAMITRNRDDYIRHTIEFFDDQKPHCGVLVIPYSIPNNQPNQIATALIRYAKLHPKGMEPYTIDFLSK